MSAQSRIAPALTAILCVALACQGESENEKKPAPATNQPALGDQHFDADQFACAKPKASKKSKSGDAKSKSKNSKLALLADPAYDPDIKKFLKKNCLGCHGPDATYPDLSTFDLAAESAADSLERMLLDADDDDVMPPGGGLKDADLELFQAWLDAGSPEAADEDEDEADAGEDEDEEEDGDTADAAARYDTKLCPQAGAKPEVEDEEDEEEEEEEEQEEETPPSTKTKTATSTKTQTATSTGTSTTVAVSFTTDIKPIIDKQCLGCHGAGTQTPPDLSTYANNKAAGALSLADIQADKMPKPPLAPLSADDKALFKAWVDAGYPENAPSISVMED